MGYGLFSRMERDLDSRITTHIVEQLGVKSSIVAGILSYPMIAAFNSIGPQTLVQSFTNKYTLIAAALIIPAKMVYNYYLGRESPHGFSSNVFYSKPVSAIGTAATLGMPLVVVNWLLPQTETEYVLKTAAEMGVIGTAKFLHDTKIKPYYIRLSDWWSYHTGQ